MVVKALMIAGLFLTGCATQTSPSEKTQLPAQKVESRGPDGFTCWNGDIVADKVECVPQIFDVWCKNGVHILAYPDQKCPVCPADYYALEDGSCEPIPMPSDRDCDMCPDTSCLDSLTEDPRDIGICTPIPSPRGNFDEIAKTCQDGTEISYNELYSGVRCPEDN